jgi:hypothetical protein
MATNEERQMQFPEAADHKEKPRKFDDHYGGVCFFFKSNSKITKKRGKKNRT